MPTGTFESFTEFELWTYGPGGGLDQLLATTGKMTFCVTDSDRVSGAPANAPTTAAYGGCGQVTQGISVGWSDTYWSTTPGQELDIRGVSNGRYAIRTTVDPENRLVESDDTNNSAVIYVEISGNSIRRLNGA